MESAKISKQMPHTNLIECGERDPSKGKWEGKCGNRENRREKVSWSGMEGLTEVGTIKEERGEKEQEIGEKEKRRKERDLIEDIVETLAIVASFSKLDLRLSQVFPHTPKTKRIPWTGAHFTKSSL